MAILTYILLRRHNREQKSASAADLLQGVCLPDRLHTLAEPAPPARDLPQLPPQPTADRRPKHQLESPRDTSGTSFVRRRLTAAEAPRRDLGYVPQRRAAADARRVMAGQAEAEAEGPIQAQHEEWRPETSRERSGPASARGMSRSSRWRAKKREEMEAGGFVRPARGYLCKICNEDVKSSETHARYFGKTYCPNDPQQHQSLREWREELRQAVLAKNAERRRDAAR